MTAFYDFFRYIKLYSTDGTTLEATLEADAVTDSLNISRGNGVAFTGANAGTDSFKIDVDYDLTVPVSTTSLRLSDVNGNNKDIALVAGGNMTITRNSSGQLTIAALVGGVSKSISAITQGNPARVTTTNAHGFTEGTPVTIVDVVGMTNLNGNEYFMDVIDSTNFDLYTDELLSTGVNSTSYPAYTSGGVATANYGGAKQAFKTIRVSGQSDIEADTIADLLTLVGGTGIDITTNAGTDTVTYAIDSSVATLNDTQILTNKTINASNNTISNIANSSLTNSSITFARVGGNSTAASLGDTVSFQGTAGEVTVGENSGTFTIGLPANVSITTGLTVNSLTVATVTGTETLTNKTLTSPVLDTGISGTAFKDEDDMTSDSNTAVASQQSIKAYADTKLALAGGTMTGTLELLDTTASAVYGPTIELFRSKASPADGDNLGQIKFNGKDSGGNESNFATIRASAVSVTAGSEDGQLDFVVVRNNDQDEVRLSIPSFAPTSFSRENVKFMAGVDLVYAGATDNANETTLTVTDPTGARTITLPDASGTVAISASSPITLSATGDIGLGTVPIANGGTNSTTAADARSALGLAIGSDVQTYHPKLTSLSILTGAADTGFYFTGTQTMTTYTLGAIGRTFLGATNIGNAAGSQRKLLGLDNDDNVQMGSLGIGTAASGTAGEIRATDNITGYYSSDSRLKENIVNISGALEKVSMLKGVTFDWCEDYIKERGGEDGYFIKKHDTGLIAQDVQQVLPEIVRKKKDGYLGVQYDKMVGLLVEAIKELRTEINELKSKR